VFYVEPLSRGPQGQGVSPGVFYVDRFQDGNHFRRGPNGSANRRIRTKPAQSPVDRVAVVKVSFRIVPRLAVGSPTPSQRLEPSRLNGLDVSGCG